MDSTQFLHNARNEDLLNATALNHKEWFRRNAEAHGGETFDDGEIAWYYSTEPQEEITLAFPCLSEEDASERINAFMAECRKRRPLRQLSCWTLDSGQPRDLGARLVARGFNWGWQPHWMALDLNRIPAGPEIPPEITVRETVEDGAEALPNIPYQCGEGVSSYRQALTSRRPKEVWSFEARREGQVVGRIILNLTRGPLGVAGIYDMGVHYSLRRKGIGTALLRAACETARDLGCGFATLNSAFDPFYDALGFESIGWGQTWWLREESLEDETLVFDPPTPSEIAFVEAVGRGDTAAMDEWGSRLTPEELNRPILGRAMTYMNLAEEMEQPASVEWLLRHGAKPSGE